MKLGLTPIVWQNFEYEKDGRDELIKDTKWQGGLNVPSGKGKRLIINHIGSKHGFLEGCGECFVGKRGSIDYHQEMNHVHFERWWETKVLPALPDKSVLLIDNAKYHSVVTTASKKPTTAWRKQQIKDWLDTKGIQSDAKDTKVKLLNKSRAIFIPKEYVLEKITKDYCTVHKKDIVVLRLPVGHSELNAIELIWAQTKNEVSRKNVTFKLADVQELMNEALSNVTPSNWAKAIKHVEKVEDAFRKIDFPYKDAEPIVDRFVINLGEEESDSELSDDCYSDGDDVDYETI